ncbi:MAG TPA: hypothetical protein GXX31_02155 [Methanothermobacter sp.]|uniref:Uncharacterized protein n=1 Tax=Methanothermobacter tenebrarum TaxID=680118 RepID=A0ABN6PAP7_9EURY|nr:hypothetical protein [Methanothermobacter tenebrarum]MDD3454422.1 hypothetical protein [Methanobacteriales archaeon]MDX9692537.1 hypothetical protein [Methanothermobacter sp.]BDH79301.1 hypothetical protein MTTB_06800 [Methanothermobacter tenebrarum]HHW16175.1 hypothetical protein [Methanothermobacter sp.]HOQ20267.1 hypothetical protein [Methanothermobacter sp.]
MISTVTATTTTTITTTTVQTCSIIAVSTLILFLALKEILGSEETTNHRIRSFVSESNIVIIPLLIVFATIVAYKVITIL